MRQVITYLMIFLILAVSFSGCLNNNENSTEFTINDSISEVDSFESSGIYSDDVIPDFSNNSEVFGVYGGYDFAESEVVGMWENIEKQSDDMIFRSDHTYRYQLDSAGIGGGWIHYKWYEGTWKIENGNVVISLHGSAGTFEDAWVFTKNENGTMNCVNNAIFKKAESIVAS